MYNIYIYTYAHSYSPSTRDVCPAILRWLCFLYIYICTYIYTYIYIFHRFPLWHMLRIVKIFLIWHMFWHTTWHFISHNLTPSKYIFRHLIWHFIGHSISHSIWHIWRFLKMGEAQPSVPPILSYTYHDQYQDQVPHYSTSIKIWK